MKGNAWRGPAGFFNNFLHRSYFGYRPQTSHNAPRTVAVDSGTAAQWQFWRRNHHLLNDAGQEQNRGFWSTPADVYEN